MRALLDEQLSPQIAVSLRTAGHDVVAVAERDDLVGSSDRIIFETATAEGRTVITNNVKDFRPLAAERLARGATHAGLILLPSTRTRSRAAVGALAGAIENALQDHPDGLSGSERWIGPLTGAESGARQPSLPTLARLVAATGSDLDLDMRLARPRPPESGAHLRHRVHQHREEVQRIAATHGLTNVRLFGSVARDEDADESDIDLLVDVAPTVSLFTLARCQGELESLLGTRVDLVPARDLKVGVATTVLAEARAL